jgi:hypothetical protein
MERDSIVGALPLVGLPPKKTDAPDQSCHAMPNSTSTWGACRARWRDRRYGAAACAASKSATITIIADTYLLRCAQEASWREDNRRIGNVERVSRVGRVIDVGRGYSSIGSSSAQNF